ncbi:TonB-dependent receptor [Pseudoduganella buxea]|uniref:Oar protein n=1 Tax=Pseudoduganella buxea TaxID=1949069 RepID=A0A6I3SRC3_9BURK|nr:carboxypeptidase regulatory-like domain-containing protein [Pseudoduganella buxea]MTV51499.1 TonB-dependent receptor plug domain-containing protein [Pseudoduganella buxea]GGB89475.1 Oar protein [Pseudoduganella buxea]
MMNHKRLRLTQIALSLSIALAAAPTFAQNTTSAIGGRISGADGNPAAGATVTIVHVESGSVNNVTTDAQGRYVARGLRVGGPYTITIEKNGVTEKRENVFVNLAETASVDAQLGQPMQTVVVAGSAVRNDRFSKTTMGAGTNISATELAIQGSINRNLQDYARTDPRVSQTDKERGELSVAGQNSRYNTLTIDGVSVSDTFGLEASGSPTSKQPISIEAIQSVQVNVANYDVTQKGYTGGNINAVTKSGTNKVKGSVYYVFRNDSTVGDRFNSSTGEYYEPAKFKETTKGATVGGPLIKDKLFIFANYEKLESTRTAPSFGPVGSSLTNVGITPAAIAQAQQIAQNRYGLDAGTDVVPVGTMLDVTDKLVKFDWNITDDHRAMFRWSKTEQSEPIFPGLSATGLSLNSYWYNQGKVIETKVAQLTSDWTPTFSTEVKLSVRDYDSVPKVNSQMPLVGLRFTGALPAGTPSGTSTNDRFLNFGTENSRQRNVLGTKTDDYYVGANWQLGAHEVKFGADYQKNEIYNAFVQNLYGNYTFACIPKIGYEFLGRNADGTLNTLETCGSNAAQTEAAVLENFRLGRPTVYQNTVANAGFSLEDAVAKFTTKNTGLFLQDTWTVSPQLTVTGGVRVDGIDVGQRPSRNALLAAPSSVGADGRLTGGFGLDNTNTFDGQKLWQPRVGFNYTLESARRTQIRGGAGLFQGSAMAVWLGNPFQNAGVATSVIGCGATGLSPCSTTASGRFSPDINNQPRLPGTSPAASVDVLASGLRQPSVWKANLAVDHELPWENLVVSAEYLKTDVRDAIFYRNVNLGDPTRIGSDGRQQYYGNAAYAENCWSATGTRITSGNCSARARNNSNASFANVLVATGTKQGGSNLATLSLSRPMISGLGWSISYTYTESKEVSPLTSSTSNSNWSGRSVFNPNEEVEANSSYLVKDRINAFVNFRKRFFGAYNTTFGLFYEGRSGKPYSWTFNNDMNGDDLAGNDLMYIPKAFGSGEVVFKGDTAANRANEQKFWDIVNGNRALRNSAGKVVDRNTSFSPWTNTFDMRVSQEVPGFWQGHKGIFTLDLFNVGNLLNKKWGRINEVGFQSNGAQARSFVDFAGIRDGKYVYQLRDKVEDFEVRQVKGESQWALQATVKYEF